MSPKGHAINKFSPTLKSSPYGKGVEHEHGRGLTAKDRIKVVKELDPTKPHNRLRSASPVRVAGRGRSPERRLPGIVTHADQPFMERNREGPSRRFQKSDKEGVAKMLRTAKKHEVNLLV